MNEAILLMGFVILICILLNRYIERIPVPSLLIFIALGMIFGENGIFRISFNNYEAVNTICSVALIFIMFYGGFGTNIGAARPVIVRSVILSTLGVAGTAFCVAGFAYFVLGLSMLESFLIGAVISSTDAASVFNILRSQKLSLKYNTDSLLELESGSNDPMSYMLTMAALALITGESLSIPALLFMQLSIGIVFGFIFGKASIWLLHKQLLPSQQSHTVFLFSMMLLSYALPSVMGGNGYLSVYLCGIMIGNSKLPQKKYLVHFFDVLTHVAQVLIFFLLGLLVTPVNLPAVILPALFIMLFMTFIGRPLVSLLILAPFRAKLGQIALVSWAGLRGAASIVFVISAVLRGVNTSYDLFDLVFCIVLISISLQGSLLPYVARKLNMIDYASDIGHTFNDYQEDSDINFIKLHVSGRHSWCGKTLAELRFPKDLLVAMIIRDGSIITPVGSTRLIAGDLLVFAARSFEDRENFELREVVVERNKEYVNRPLSEISEDHEDRIILIKRGIDTIIPSGSTVIRHGDILVLSHVEKK